MMRIRKRQSQFRRTPFLNSNRFRGSTRSICQGKMSPRFLNAAGAAAIAAMLVLSSQAFAQSDDPDSEMRIQRLENQLRQLTGQKEEPQNPNRESQQPLGPAQDGTER